jgi:hypothetical protein
MTDSTAKAVYDLTYAYGVQLRFNGLLLHMLIAKNVMTEAEARLLLEETASKMPDDNVIVAQYAQLLREFQPVPPRKRIDP